MAHIWVIEMFIYNKWWPSVGMAISRERARKKMKEWKNNPQNINDKFRIRKYVREEK